MEVFLALLHVASQNRQGSIAVSGHPCRFRPWYEYFPVGLAPEREVCWAVQARTDSTAITQAVEAFCLLL